VNSSGLAFAALLPAAEHIAPAAHTSSHAIRPQHRLPGSCRIMVLILACFAENGTMAAHPGSPSSVACEMHPVGGRTWVSRRARLTSARNGD
jgi:hypothetical protein